MTNLSLAEYIWGDGSIPVRNIRSKAKVISLSNKDKVTIEDFPQWTFDGSSTYQANGDKSDLLLQPVNFVKDPIRGEGNYLVMCEVLNADGTPHESNSRAQLREVLAAGGAAAEAWAGFEQEYTLFNGRNPLGWPENGFPAPQGPYYCGVGAEEIFGREVAEAHAEACIEAGLIYYGLNAEVMPAQWEYQIGFRGHDGDNMDILNLCDHAWIARWLLYRVGEEFGIRVSIDNKPIKGDWNGAGMHTNFSTKATRDAKNGRKAIDDAITKLSKKHQEHIAVYGHALHERLTGLHETCDINTFRSGDSDRGSSIRIPQNVVLKGSGYFEDRRPGANSDPYLVSARILTTICDIDESVFKFHTWPRNNVTKLKVSGGHK